MNTKQSLSGTQIAIDQEDAREDTLWGMFRSFYNRRMLSVIVIVWVYALVFMAIAIFCGLQFFKTVNTRDQIMYAAVFLTSIQFIAIMKIFAWQMIHRNSIKQAIRRLDARLNQLSMLEKQSTRG